jgi:hypothetical protein
MGQFPITAALIRRWVESASATASSKKRSLEIHTQPWPPRKLAISCASGFRGSICDGKGVMTTKRGANSIVNLVVGFLILGS